MWERDVYTVIEVMMVMWMRLFENGPTRTFRWVMMMAVFTAQHQHQATSNNVNTLHTQNKFKKKTANK